MQRIALFAGSFDPITNGHLDVVGKAVRLADRLVLAVGIHPGKTPLFSAEERLAMLNEICAPLGRAAGCEIVCTTFADLVVTAARACRRHHPGPRRARRHRFRLRDADGRHERDHGAGRADRFLPAAPAVRPITATLVRQIAGMGGDVSAFVPAPVAAQLKTKFAKK